MKSENQIRHKLQQVVFRHRKKALRTNFLRVPESCHWNGEFDHEGSSTHVCLYGADHPANWKGIICDSSFAGGVEQARACPFWKSRKTEEEIKSEFSGILAQDLGVIAAVYPDVAALLWVLDEEPGIDVEEEVDNGRTQSIISGWWSRLFNNTKRSGPLGEGPSRP